MSVAWLIWAAAEAVFAAAAVMGGVSGNEPLLGAGAAGALLGLALAPAIAVRARRRRQIADRQDTLLRFEYSAAEVHAISAVARREVRGRSVRLSLFFSVACAVLFAFFIAISAEEGAVSPALTGAAAACVVLPWLSVLIAPAVAVHTVRRTPCESILGRSSLLVANRYPGINDRVALTAEQAHFAPAKNGGMAMLRVRYRYRAGRVGTDIRQWVEIPVPYGHEAEAAALKL